MTAKGGILGVGNVLQRDDGIGIKTIKYLDSQYFFPDHVTLIDGGTVGAGLDTLVVDKEWLIVLDALNVPGEPGEIRLLRGEDFDDRPPDLKMSPHQVGFLDLVQAMRLEGVGPTKLDLIGIIPKNLDFGTDICEVVDAAMKTAVEILLDWLKQRGVVPERRDPIPQPDYWWL